MISPSEGDTCLLKKMGLFLTSVLINVELLWWFRNVTLEKYDGLTYMENSKDFLENFTYFIFHLIKL